MKEGERLQAPSLSAQAHSLGSRAAPPTPSTPWGSVSRGKALGSGQRAWGGLEWPAELLPPRPAGADDATERADAPAADESPGGRSAQSQTGLPTSTGAWARGGSLRPPPAGGDPSARPLLRKRPRRQNSRKPPAAYLAGSVWHLLCARPHISLLGVKVEVPKSRPLRSCFQGGVVAVCPPIGLLAQEGSTIVRWACRVPGTY